MAVARRHLWPIRSAAVVASVSLCILVAWCFQATDDISEEAGSRLPVLDASADDDEDALTVESSPAPPVDEESLDDPGQRVEPPTSKKEVTNLSKIFSIQYLPVPVVLDHVERKQPKVHLDQVLPQKEHLAIFMSEHPRGSSRLRGDMMAAAVSTIPGWSAVIIKNFGTPNVAVNRSVDMCVFVKRMRPPHYRWCKALGAKALYWDLVDNCAALQKHYGWNRSTRLLPGVVMLAPDAAVMQYIRYLSPQSAGDRPSAETLYHQHTNPGFLAPSSRLSIPFICRAAVFLSNPRHSPSDNARKGFHARACLVPTVWSFAFLQQIPGKRQESHPDMQIFDEVCPNRSEDMARVCMAADEEIRARGPPKMLAANSSGFPEQAQFHSDLESGLVDVIFVMSEASYLCQRHRPSTRLLHWMSHGVPVLFYPAHSYEELAIMGNYTLPDGQPPVLEDKREVAKVLAKMAPSHVRTHLRERGLALAANYSVLSVAEKLVDMYLHPDPVLPAYPGPYYTP